MSVYAKGTSVSAEKSRAEIETTLRRYGADRFAYATDATSAQVAFEAAGRRVRFSVQFDSLDEHRLTETGRDRSDAAAYKAWEQSTRERWRSLCLLIKAKLEAIDSGIAEFETEFLPHLVLPGGVTIGERLAPQLEQVCSTGNLPPLLAAPGGSR